MLFYQLDSLQRKSKSRCRPGKFCRRGTLQVWLWFWKLADWTLDPGVRQKRQLCWRQEKEWPQRYLDTWSKDPDKLWNNRIQFVCYTDWSCNEGLSKVRNQAGYTGGCFFICLITFTDMPISLTSTNNAKITITSTTFFVLLCSVVLCFVLFCFSFCFSLWFFVLLLFLSIYVWFLSFLSCFWLYLIRLNIFAELWPNNRRKGRIRAWKGDHLEYMLALLGCPTVHCYHRSLFAHLITGNRSDNYNDMFPDKLAHQLYNLLGWCVHL